MRRLLIAAVIFFAGASCALILTHGSSQAQSDGEVMAKLNEIARGQQDVIAAVNSMKEDIQIIKISVTQLQ